MKNTLGSGKFLIKITISALLLAFLIHKLSIQQLKSILNSLDTQIFIAAGALLLASNCLGAAQWHLLLRSSGIKLRFNFTFRLYFVGLFFNNFLPANVGGDAVKIYDVSRIGASVYQVLAVTVLDRILGIFGLCLLASAATVILIPGSHESSYWLYLAVFAACMIPAVGFYMIKPLGSLMRSLLLKIRAFSIDRRAAQVLDGLGEFKSRKLLILKLVGLSLVIQGMRVGTHIIVARALGIHLSLLVVIKIFVFVPLLSLAMVPPVTINGLGVREGLGMVLFPMAGIARPKAFVIEFLTYFISVLISLVGWFFFVGRNSIRTGSKRE